MSTFFSQLDNLNQKYFIRDKLKEHTRKFIKFQPTIISNLQGCVDACLLVTPSCQRMHKPRRTLIVLPEHISLIIVYFYLTTLTLVVKMKILITCGYGSGRADCRKRLLV